MSWLRESGFSRPKDQKFLINFNIPLTSISTEDLPENETTLFRALGSDKGCGYTMYVQTSSTSSFS